MTGNSFYISRLFEETRETGETRRTRDIGKTGEMGEMDVQDEKKRKTCRFQTIFAPLKQQI